MDAEARTHVPMEHTIDIGEAVTVRDLVPSVHLATARLSTAGRDPMWFEKVECHSWINDASHRSMISQRPWQRV